MVKPICTDMVILSKKSAPATKADLPVMEDLLDTLGVNAERCVGMAANMIGVNKCIIAFSVGAICIPMLNPEIVKRKEPYETEEGCLSLSGTRKTTRYKSIEVTFFDRKFQKQRQAFSGFPAQIIQHEIDHCNGILI